MKTTASRTWNPRRFDVRAFAEAGARLSGEEALAGFERLAGERHADGDAALSVQWAVQAETRPNAAGQPDVWMRLEARLLLPVGCQRCLGPVGVPLEVDRWFRFVADEATAETEDDASEEDVLALEPKPDLLALIEDELLMEIPLVPMHDVCPAPLSASAQSDTNESPTEARPNPFASLAGLKKQSP